MSTAIAPPPIPVFVVQPPARWNTPQILWRALWVIWVLDLLLLGALLMAGRVHLAALKAIGKDSAPSIIASQQIKTALADMDANAANELLADPGKGKSAFQTYVDRRTEAATALIGAAQNITYGDAERLPIINIQLGFGEYEAAVQRARDLREAGKPSFVGAYNHAAVIMDHTILPAADALDEANLKELNAAYASQGARSRLVRALVLLAAGGLLCLLGAIQLFLWNRTHRLINVPLFAASLLAFFFMVYSLNALGLAQSGLKRAKEDAFTSIHALWRARAVAYAANGDESRFLLDPAQARERTDGFMAKRDLLVKLPVGATYQTEAQVAGSGSRPHFTGYLADELNNITFPGERESATEALKAFGQYIDIDSKIRDLASHGQQRAALELCVGTAEGQSNWAFGRFDDALGRTLKINQDAFDRSVSSGFAALKNFETKAAAFAVLFGVMCLLGLLQRIREYN